MLKCELNLQAPQRFRKGLDKKLIQGLVERALEMEGVSSPVEIDLLLTTDETVHRLNLKYRGVNRTTDVLSFPLANSGQEETPFVTPPNGVLHLGQVVISYPQAERQAEEQSESVGKEIARLVVHGVLHLLGYNHEKPKENRRMQDKEEQVLQNIAQHL